MIELDLKTNNKSEELIKQYLQKNVSQSLADKINNGVKIQKDNKTLISKKDLSGFMKYANNEARKLAQKGASCACIEDKTVYAWAIHYFEEDTIEGNLFNEDGSEYKPIVKTNKTTSSTKVEPKKEENKQETLFDIFDFNNTKEAEIKEPSKEIEIDKQDYIKPKIDYETGEVLLNSPTKTLDKELVNILHSLLDGKLEVK